MILVTADSTRSAPDILALLQHGYTRTHTHGCEEGFAGARGGEGERLLLLLLVVVVVMLIVVLVLVLVVLVLVVGDGDGVWWWWCGRQLLFEGRQPHRSQSE